MKLERCSSDLKFIEKCSWLVNPRNRNHYIIANYRDETKILIVDVVL